MIHGDVTRPAVPRRTQRFGTAAQLATPREELRDGLRHAGRRWLSQPMVSGSVPGSANDPFGEAENAFSKLESPYLSHSLCFFIEGNRAGKLKLKKEDIWVCGSL